MTKKILVENPSLLRVSVYIGYHSRIYSFNVPTDLNRLHFHVDHIFIVRNKIRCATAYGMENNLSVKNYNKTKSI